MNNKSDRNRNFTPNNKKKNRYRLTNKTSNLTDPEPSEADKDYLVISVQISGKLHYLLQSSLHLHED